jgi:predicted negative regulator of RcsB-dependent stress response
VLTRKDLKTDKFAVEAEHVFEVVATHPDQVKRYAAIALAVAVLGAGFYFYRTNQASARADALAAAMKIDDDGIVSNNPVANKVVFKTQDELTQARTKAFTDVMTKYSGSREGAIGGIYLAATAADKGDMAQAEKLFKQVVDTAPADFASVATLSLAKIYAAEGKGTDAEKLLRAVIASPTTLVSKEQATIELADVLTKSNPAEARKLLEPLRIGRSSISRAAVSMLGNLPQNN